MSAFEVPGFAYSAMSEGNIGQFRAVLVNANGAVEAAGADEAVIDGVAQMPADTAAPETIRVMKDGITIAECSAAITAGEYVRTQANGRFAATASQTTPLNAVGKALTTTGAAGELFALLLY